MKIFKIQKRPGKWRTIYAPNAEEKAALRDLLPAIAAEAAKLDDRQVQHGFAIGRSPVTNAMQHIGYAYSLCMDLEDFFDSVTPEHVPGKWRKPELFPDGAARQGLPTSPALANFAAAAMDKEILALQQYAPRFGLNFIYTRYADDLTFSYQWPWIGEMLLQEVPKIVERHKFKVNGAKTHQLCAVAGRRIITGIAVGNKGIYPTRAIRRRYRAAKHQRHTSEARGLAEWMTLTAPKQYQKPKRKISLAPAPSKTKKSPSQAVPTGLGMLPKRKFDLDIE